MRRNLEIVPVTSVEEVLEQALVSPLVPIKWVDDSDDDAPVSATKADKEEEQSGLVKH